MPEIHDDAPVLTSLEREARRALAVVNRVLPLPEVNPVLAADASGLRPVLFGALLAELFDNEYASDGPYAAGAGEGP